MKVDKKNSLENQEVKKKMKVENWSLKTSEVKTQVKEEYIEHELILNDT